MCSDWSPSFLVPQGLDLRTSLDLRLPVVDALAGVLRLPAHSTFAGTVFHLWSNEFAGDRSDVAIAGFPVIPNAPCTVKVPESVQSPLGRHGADLHVHGAALTWGHRSMERATHRRRSKVRCHSEDESVRDDRH
jgi:hypothetical protein